MQIILLKVLCCLSACGFTFLMLTGRYGGDNIFLAIIAVMSAYCIDEQEE